MRALSAEARAAYHAIAAALEKVKALDRDQSIDLRIMTSQWKTFGCGPMGAAIGHTLIQYMPQGENSIDVRGE